MPDPPGRTERRDGMTARASSGTQRCASARVDGPSDGVQIDTYLDRGDIELWDTRAAPWQEIIPVRDRQQ
jgi:hypothetical protein